MGSEATIATALTVRKSLCLNLGCVFTSGIRISRNLPSNGGSTRKRNPLGSRQFAPRRFPIWLMPPPPIRRPVWRWRTGTIFYGKGFGATGQTTAELCFNTAMTGYQEIMTDPSYAGQIVTFTFPHVGNVGVNPDDDETADPVAEGMVVKWDPDRAQQLVCDRTTGRLAGASWAHRDWRSGYTASDPRDPSARCAACGVGA